MRCPFMQLQLKSWSRLTSVQHAIQMDQKAELTLKTFLRIYIVSYFAPPYFLNVMCIMCDIVKFFS